MIRRDIAVLATAAILSCPLLGAKPKTQTAESLPTDKYSSRFGGLRDLAKEMSKAACAGDEPVVRALLAYGLDWSWDHVHKYAAKGIKCANKNGYSAIADLVERARAGETILTMEEEGARAAAAEGDKAAASGDAKTALSRYTDALQSIPRTSALDGSIREKIIRLARTMGPPPPVPEEARRMANRGALFTKKANSQADYEDAISELVQASTLAPWWPDPYFNLGLVLEKTRRYDEAAASLRFYLLAAPDAADRPDVETKLDELEVEKRMSERQESTHDHATEHSRPSKPAVR